MGMAGLIFEPRPTKGWEVIICIETYFQYFIGSGLHAFDVLSKNVQSRANFCKFCISKNSVKMEVKKMSWKNG